jgi:hypothetical protein
MKIVILTILFSLLMISPAYSTDFTDSDQMYGWNTTSEKQFFQTWAEHKAQLGLLYHPLTVGLVSKVGTPVDSQIGVWTGDGTIEGTSNFTFDGGVLSIDASTASLISNLTNGLDTGISAWQVVNDAGYRGSMGLAGSAHAVVDPSSFSIFQQGYGDTNLIVDGNNDFVWSTDATDSHDLSYTEKMRLSADGTLTIGKASTVTGAYILENSTNANTFTIQPGVTVANIGLILPTTVSGGDDYLLNVDADGTMGYTDPASIGGVSDTAYGVGWDGDTDTSASKNALYDKIEALSGTSPLTTKGDIYTYSTVGQRLGVGTDGYLLCADSGEATGLNWCGSLSIDIILEDASSTTDGQLTFDGTFDQLELGDGASTNTFSNDTVNAAAYHPINGALKTTGEVQAIINVLTKGSAYTLGTDEATEVGGSLVIGTAAMVLTLPSAAAGYSGCFIAGQGVAAIIQLAPASGDYLVVDGSRGTVATAYASAGGLGDKICFIAANADDWYITSEVGTWSE